MAHKDVVDAVHARVGTAWSGLPVLRLNDNSVQRPSDGSAFIQVQFPASRTERLPINERLYREVGGFRFVISGKSGNGLSDVLTWAEGLAALFRDQEFDGVRCQVPGSPFLDDSNDDGLYFVCSLVVPYEFQFRG
jgi:hypothetical protein